jgi:hypothetical protein
MTQTRDPDAHPSELLYATLQRTLALAQEWGMVSTTEQEWRYRDGEHLLIYDPTTQELQFINTQTDENWHWCEGKLADDAPLTDEQWAEFEELSEWLDTQGSAELIEIQTVRSRTSEDIVALESTAAQLFEYYASQRVPAYQLSKDSTIHYYSMEVDGMTYLLSRDDATGEYNVQREESGLDLRSRQGITQHDIQTWREIEEWLSAFVEMDSSQYSAWDNFGWEVGTENIEP